MSLQRIFPHGWQSQSTDDEQADPVTLPPSLSVLWLCHPCGNNLPQVRQQYTAWSTVIASRLGLRHNAGMNTKHALAIVIVALGTLAARAEETEVLFDGAGISGWDAARDQERLKREFAISELSAVRSPPALAWRFVSKGIPFNDLFLRKPIERSFRQVRVLVRNAGEAVEFAAKVCDASGAEWTVPPVALPQGDEWRWVEFPRDAWRVASWSRDAGGSPVLIFGLRGGFLSNGTNIASVSSLASGSISLYDGGEGVGSASVLFR